MAHKPVILWGCGWGQAVTMKGQRSGVLRVRNCSPSWLHEPIHVLKLTDLYKRNEFILLSDHLKSTIKRINPRAVPSMPCLGGVCWGSSAWVQPPWAQRTFPLKSLPPPPRNPKGECGSLLPL